MKYIIDVPDNTHWIQWIMEGTKDHHPYAGWKHVEDLIPYDEPDRKAIEDEIWNFIMNTDFAWVSEVGDKPIGAYSYQEAKAKFEAWKKHKGEIHVGDEVTSKFGDGVVIDIVADESVHILGKDGHWNEYAEGEYRKTGRHFNEVEELMKKMRGE